MLTREEALIAAKAAWNYPLERASYWFDNLDISDDVDAALRIQADTAVLEHG